MKHFCKTKVGMEVVTSFFKVRKHLISVFQLLILFGKCCKTNNSSRNRGHCYYAGISIQMAPIVDVCRCCLARDIGPPIHNDPLYFLFFKRYSPMLILLWTFTLCNFKLHTSTYKTLFNCYFSKQPRTFRHFRIMENNITHRSRS